MTNDDMRERSGSINASSRLTSFLYDLMRDHLTPGVVEELVQESVEIEVAYTNGWLAQHAFDLANRLCPPQFTQGGIVKDILQTHFRMVKEGKMTLSKAAEKIYDAITKGNSQISTGKSHQKNETVDPPRVKDFEKGFSKQSILEAEDELAIKAIEEAGGSHLLTPNLNKGPTIVRLAPTGLYGVFCEPKGHKHDPGFTASEPQPYEGAVKEADFMNRSNHAWHYYAKPIR